MLTALSIRDVVLVDRLDLRFEPGLSTLTGETGAGKSILLDALGLALGARGDSGLVRHGAEQAVVAASFDLPPAHAIRALLKEQGMDGGNEVILRRVMGADGRSRGYINDQPAGVGLLRQVGGALVEIQGQFEQQGLIDPGTHRAHLDAYGGAALAREAAGAAEAWRAWRAAEAALAEARTLDQRADADEAFLRHARGEIDALDPKPDEEQALAQQRALLMNREKLTQAVDAALHELTGERGTGRGMAAARRALERAAPQSGGKLDAPAAALGRAEAELAEALSRLQALAADEDLDPRRLEQIEERLFALRGLARKHRVEVSALAALKADFENRLAAIADRAGTLDRLGRQAAAARAAYAARAEALTQARKQAASRLDAAVARELPPLKLGKAKFATSVAPAPESDWSEHGCDRVRFEAATNPGQPLGALNRVASGGELSRFMLALKVVMARGDPVPTLVFDEVDAGIGGAVADAVGERLARLAREVQVLVVTHSPQVAARAAHHLRVSKTSDKTGTLTRVAALDASERREEVARMLSGAAVTAEARAAAERLIGDAGRKAARR